MSNKNIVAAGVKLLSLTAKTPATGARLLSLTARQAIKESDEIVEAVAQTAVQVVQNSTEAGSKSVMKKVKDEVIDWEKLRAQWSIDLYKKVNAPKAEIGRKLDTGRTYDLKFNLGDVGKQNAEKVNTGVIKTTYELNRGWLNGLGSMAYPQLWKV